MTSVYLAARYSRREELLAYREDLERAGFTVTSRWLNGFHQIGNDGKPIGEQGEALVEGEHDDGSSLRRKFVTEDVEDVEAAEIVISFTELPRIPHPGRGGRHVEFGFALARRRFGYRVRLIVVGHRENLFHWSDAVEYYATWPEAVAVLRAEGERTA